MSVLCKHNTLCRGAHGEGGAGVSGVLCAQAAQAAQAEPVGGGDTGDAAVEVLAATGWGLSTLFPQGRHRQDVSMSGTEPPACRPRRAPTGSQATAQRSPGAGCQPGARPRLRQGAGQGLLLVHLPSHRGADRTPVLQCPRVVLAGPLAHLVVSPPLHEATHSGNREDRG